MIHHNTLKKATALGFTIEQVNNSDVIAATWPDKNKTGYAANGASAAALVESMKTWQMLVREYPALRAAQPYAKDGNYVWEVTQQGKVVGEGASLTDAFDDALDAISAKTAKPTKKIVAVNGAADDEDDEEGDPSDDELSAEGDEDAEEEGGKSIVKRKYKTRYRPFKQTCGDELAQLISKHIKVKDEDDGKLRIDRKKLVHFAKANGVWVGDYAHLNIGQVRMNVGNRLRAKLRHEPEYEIVWN